MKNMGFFYVFVQSSIGATQTRQGLDSEILFFISMFYERHKLA